MKSGALRGIAIGHRPCKLVALICGLVSLHTSHMAGRPVEELHHMEPVNNLGGLGHPYRHSKRECLSIYIAPP